MYTYSCSFIYNNDFRHQWVHQYPMWECGSMYWRRWWVHMYLSCRLHRSALWNWYVYFFNIKYGDRMIYFVSLIWILKWPKVLIIISEVCQKFGVLRYGQISYKTHFWHILFFKLVNYLGLAYFTHYSTAIYTIKSLVLEFENGIRMFLITNHTLVCHFGQMSNWFAHMLIYVKCWNFNSRNLIRLKGTLEITVKCKVVEWQV